MNAPRYVSDKEIRHNSEFPLLAVIREIKE